MHLTITPHDPLVARDARSFGEGNGARTMEWFNPSVGAGSLRSLLGKLGGGFSPDMVVALKASSTRGAFPMLGEDIFVHYPSDFVARKSDGALFPLRPANVKIKEEGTNIPEEIYLCFPEGLVPDAEDFKPLRPPLFWSLARMEEWLVSTCPAKEFAAAWKKSGGKHLPQNGFLSALPKDGRTHVRIDPTSGASSEGMLFSTSGLTFLCETEEGVQPLQMAMTVECVKEYLSQVADVLDAHHPMGSERRLAHWKREPEKDSRWKCPDGIRQSLVERSRIRMILASPAPFSEGWLPGWLKQKEEGIIGTPPGCEVKLRLVSAVTGRWQPISGWAIEQGKPQGPKALRRMVPAGSVYFFETIGDSAGSLAEIWLKSVCDDEQDRSDGFGLALWGIW